MQVLEIIFFSHLRIDLDFKFAHHLVWPVHYRHIMYLHIILERIPESSGDYESESGDSTLLKRYGPLEHLFNGILCICNRRYTAAHSDSIVTCSWGPLL